MFDISFGSLASVLELIPCGRVVTVGGMAATASYQKVLDENPKVDAVCYYEGEQPFIELVSTGIYGSGWITRRYLDIGIKPEKNLITDLEKVVDIDYSFVNVDDYPMSEIFSPYALQGKQKRFFLITSRGCPFSCRFCMHSADPDKTMRYASVEKVIQHVKYLKDSLGMTVLTIYDDQLLYNKKRAKVLFSELAKLKIGRIECPNGLSVAFMDEELIRLMKEAGMDTVQLAIESGSEYVLKELVHKPLNLKQVKPVIDLCHKYGLWTTGYFVVGMPGETDAMRFETVKFIMESGLDWASFNVAICTHGSDLYRECLEKGYIPDKENIVELWSVYSIKTPEYTTEHITEMNYAMNLFVNFVHNASIRSGKYDLAMKAFMNVLTVVPDHMFAYRGIAGAAAARYSEVSNPEWKHYENMISVWENSMCREKI
jgi:radical SAM superfamily enzyme YgiQ (UPF0313 family)